MDMVRGLLRLVPLGHEEDRGNQMYPVETKPGHTETHVKPKS